jgi:orotate phosphoribosyltransferase
MTTTAAAAERLYRRAMEIEALKFGDFTLTSGQKSTFYFDGRLLSLDPEGSDLISQEFLKAIRQSGAEAFGGPAVGAVPIVGALTLRSWQEGAGLSGFFVRSEAKKHGMGRQVEGSVLPGMKVAVFDDTVSTGGSLFIAVDAIQEYGCEIVLVLAVMDRNQGGSAELARRRLPFYRMWEATPEGKIIVDAGIK